MNHYLMKAAVDIHNQRDAGLNQDALLSEAPSSSVQLLRSGIQELTAGKTLSTFAGVATFSSPSTCGALARSGPPKWPSLSPPPTLKPLFIIAADSRQNRTVVSE